MKPQSLQDAIKANALKKKDRFSKGEWKEPVVKIHKVTAEDLAAEKSRGVGAAPPVVAGGVSAAETVALRNELAMLREEMRSNIRQLKEEQRKAIEAAEAAAGQAPAAAPAPTPETVDNSLREETEALKQELDSLKTELTTIRTKLNRAVDSIPDEMNDLREELRQIQEETSSARGAPPVSLTNGSSNGEGDALAKDVRKTKSEIKELRMMVSQSQDGTTLARELRVIVDQQETTLETQAEVLEDLKEQVRILKRRLETAEFTAKEALELAHKKSVPVNGVVTTAIASPPSSPVPKVIPMSPTNKKSKNITPSTGTGSSTRVGETSLSSMNSMEEEEDDDPPPQQQSKSKYQQQQPKQKPHRLYDEATGETKLELLHLDSEDEESTDGSDLYPVKNTPLPSDRLLTTRPSGAKQRGGDAGNNGTTTGKTTRAFCPSSIVLDKDGTYNYKSGTEDDSDDDSDDDDDYNYNKSPKESRKTNISPPTARKPQAGKDYSKAPMPGSPTKPSTPKSTPKRRDPGSDDETTTSDDDSVPKKKTISLLPHRSDALYQEQRKDPVLRKFITEAKSPDMTVHQVHGKNLVFFSGCVYIPATLRQQTMDYYIKKHSYNPLVSIQKHCFWPDLEDDMKKCLNKGSERWRVEAANT